MVVNFHLLTLLLYFVKIKPINLTFCSIFSFLVCSALFVVLLVN